MVELPRSSTSTEIGLSGAAVAAEGVAALFDMDYTVLRGSSGRLYLSYLHRKGYLSGAGRAAIALQVGMYLVGFIEFPQLMARVMSRVAGADESETWRISEAWFDEILHDHIAMGARERIDWHRRLGHHVAIVSASTPYAVKPVARDLGLGDAYLATQLEVVSGRFTGRVLEPACFGAGKLSLARAYAARHQIDLGVSYFYTDSHHDLPLMEAVGHPVAVNPSRELAAIASERQWPVERFY